MVHPATKLKRGSLRAADAARDLNRDVPVPQTPPTSAHRARKADEAVSARLQLGMGKRNANVEAARSMRPWVAGDLRIPKLEEAKGTKAEEVFQALTIEWRKTWSDSASLEQVMVSTPYQKIIGLGPIAVPLMLEQLTRHLEPWFWALGAITRENPVGDAERRSARATREAWLKWGREHGIVAR